MERLRRRSGEGVVEAACGRWRDVLAHEFVGGVGASLGVLVWALVEKQRVHGLVRGKQKCRCRCRGDDSDSR